MDYTTYKIADNYSLVTVDILSSSSKKILDFCDADLVEHSQMNKDKFSQKSIAKSLEKTIFNNNYSQISLETSGCNIIKAMQHQNSMPKLILEYYEYYLENDDSNKPTLIITQSEYFKSKFLFDSSTITKKTFLEGFQRFNTIIGKYDFPKIYLLVLNNLENCEVTILKKGVREKAILYNYE